MGFFDKFFKKEFAGDIDKFLEQQKKQQEKLREGQEKIHEKLEQGYKSPSAPQKQTSKPYKIQRTQKVKKPYPAEDAAKLQKLNLPVLRAKDDLARILSTNVKTLNYLATDSRSHYCRFTIPKRSGDGTRSIFAPKKKLKDVQRKILIEILGKLPVTENAHGFVKKRSILTNVSPHTGKEIIVKIDLESFFDTVNDRRVYGLLRSFGYGHEIANMLTKLTTVYDSTPQGAPTSPAISNAVTMKLDKRLNGLAKKFLANYTRYADDITFSGGNEFKARLKSFLLMLWVIIREEGFRINKKKTVLVRKGNRQIVTGLVVNKTPGVSRKERDTLRAILHNAKHKGGLETQNRQKVKNFRAHVDGKIEFVKFANPAQGAKLERQRAGVSH